MQLTQLENKAQKREETGKNDTAIVRIEQLYPFPKKQVDKIIEKYKNAKQYTWVQEEPENMGAWGFILQTIRNVDFKVISRPASASTASGSSKRAEKRQQAIINAAFE